MYVILNNQPQNKAVDLVISGPIFDGNGDFVPNIFNAGESLTENSYTIRAHKGVSRQGELKDKLCIEVNGASELFVVSPKVVSLLRQYNTSNMEFIDLSIEGTEVEVSNYSLVNFLGKVDCMDDENSECMYVEDTDYIYAIDHLALHEDNIPDTLSIFLMERTDNLVVVVRQDLATAIQEAGLTGFAFLEPCEFDIG